MEKDYVVLEDFELFWDKDGNSGIEVKEGTIINGFYNNEKGFWEFNIDGIIYWQYNYSIEDFILEV